ncbi:MAG: response regulator [Desulfuromonadales bacterium]|nr:response regulator [Desulfuromonadales bacterium]
MGQEITKVLIVEDDPDFAESLMIALGVRDCHVDIARTGEEAIRKFHSLCYDIAFMDIKLPGKNGVESLAEIRGFCPSAHVVMMTGFSESAVLDKALQAGAVDILRKPFRLKEMFAHIDKLQTDSSPTTSH